MDLVCSANVLWGRLRNAEITYLPRANQLRHSPDCLFDWDPWIDSMQIIEIDLIHAEPLQRLFTGSARIIGRPIDSAILHRGIDCYSELGGQNHTVPPAFQSLANLDLRISID